MHIARPPSTPGGRQARASTKKLDFVAMLLHIVPTSFFSPFAEGEVLPVLFVAIVLGFGLRRAGPGGQVFVGGLKSFSQGLFAAFGMLMRLAPIGAFGAMAYTVAKNGLHTIGNLGLLIGTLYVASLFFVFVVLWRLARMHGFSLLKLLRYIREELLIVLGTSSTEPVLPAHPLEAGEPGLRQGLRRPRHCRSATPSTSTAPRST